MSRRAFTLTELLISIGIIALLVGMILFVIPSTWDRANQTRCQSNLRTLTQAFMAFADEHDRHLPGSIQCYYTDQAFPDHWDWLFGQYSILDSQTDPATGKPFTSGQRVKMAPQWGTLWKYLSNNCDPNHPTSGALNSYRCPSLSLAPPGSGYGSNGRFDYAAFSCFSGAALNDINPVSELHFQLDPNNSALMPDTNAPGKTYGFSSHVEFHPTPLICHEDARLSINSSMEGQHSGANQMTHIHSGGSWYAGVDGGVYFVNEPDTDPSNVGNGGTLLWWQRGPRSHELVSLDGDPGWGGWSHR